MTSRSPSNRTRTPVSTGRDSSRDAARPTLSIVSSSAFVSMRCSETSSGGRRGKSSALYTLSRDEWLPEVTESTPSPSSCASVHRVRRKEPHEIGEKASGHDDAGVSSDLASDRRAQRDLHVRRGEREPVVLGLEQDSAEDLHRSARRDRSRDHAESRGELGLRTGDAKRGVGRHVCSHYWKKQDRRSSRSVSYGEDRAIVGRERGKRVWTEVGVPVHGSNRALARSSGPPTSAGLLDARSQVPAQGCTQSGPRE